MTTTPTEPQSIEALAADLETALPFNVSDKARLHAARVLASRGYRKTQPTDALVDAVAREIAPNLDRMHSIVQYDIKDRTRQVLAALGRVNP